MKEAASLVALTHDPGGAEALVPLLSELSSSDHLNVIVYVGGKGRGVLDREGFQVHRVEVQGGDCPEWTTYGQELIRRHGADLVLTGTSFVPGPELGLLRAARILSVPAIAVLDQWTNYHRRFLAPGESALDADALPDVVAVMDDFATQEMVSEGFPLDRLRVVGHPGLERFSRWVSSSEGQEEGQDVRSALGLKSCDILVSFFSQPISDLYGTDTGTTSRGYDEQQVFLGLREALAMIVREDKTSVRLVVKLHPKEFKGKYPKEEEDEFSFTMVESSGGDAILAASDLVVGMTSMALIKAFVAGKQVISYQPDLIGPDAMVLGRAGYLETAKTPDMFADQIRCAVTGRQTARTENRLSRALTDGGSVGRLMALIQELLEDNLRVDGLGAEVCARQEHVRT